jgi:hypothetical protein
MCEESISTSLHLLADFRVGQQAADGVCSGIPSLPDVDMVTVLPIVARRYCVWYRSAAVSRALVSTLLSDARFPAGPLGDHAACSSLQDRASLRGESVQGGYQD